MLPDCQTTIYIVKKKEKEKMRRGKKKKCEGKEKSTSTITERISGLGVKDKFHTCKFCCISIITRKSLIYPFKCKEKTYKRMRQGNCALRNNSLGQGSIISEEWLLALLHSCIITCIAKITIWA